MAGFDALAHSHHYDVAGNALHGHLRLHRARPSPGVDGTDDLGLYPEGGHFPVFIRFDAHGRLQTVELRAFRDGSLHLFRQSRHIRLPSSVGDSNLFRAQADGGTGTVHGHVSAAHHQYGLSGEIRRIVIPDIPKHLHRGDHALGVLSLNADLFIIVRADGDINRVKILSQAAQGNIVLPVSDIHARMYLHACGENGLDVLIQPLPGEAVIGNAVAKHAAQLALLLEHHRMVPHQLQIISRGKTARPAARNGDPLARGGRLFRNGHRIRPGVVHRHAL